MKLYTRLGSGVLAGLLGLVLFGSALGHNSHSGLERASLNPDEARAYLARTPRVFILDVREIHEYRAWHLPGAVNIPVKELGERLPEVPVGRPILIACHWGPRAKQAYELIRLKKSEAGPIYWVNGGYLQYAK